MGRVRRMRKDTAWSGCNDTDCLRLLLFCVELFLNVLNILFRYVYLENIVVKIYDINLVAVQSLWNSTNKFFEEKIMFCSIRKPYDSGLLKNLALYAERIEENRLPITLLTNTYMAHATFVTREIFVGVQQGFPLNKASFWTTCHNVFLLNQCSF
jgi:hypothetical protein